MTRTRPYRWRARVYSAVVLLAACAKDSMPQGSTGPMAASTSSVVAVEANAGAVHQVMEGFGATTSPLIYMNGADDKLPPAIRARALEAVYRDVRLTLGNVSLGPFEPENDNADPQRLNEAALELDGVRALNEKLVVPARGFGADGLYPGNGIDLFATPWMMAIRAANYDRYIDECAEYVVAGVLEWRAITGEIPRYHALFNEPTMGNTELRGGSTREMIDIIKRAGARLRSAGMPTKFIVPSEETPSASASLARAILADPQARQYVGAIGYHPYPYGSAYASMARILAGPGTGRRDDAAVMERRVLRDLGRQYNIPVWMTEVSHGGLDPRSMDAVRARAIQIHDELGFADAAAFFGMMAMWDSRSNAEHFNPPPPLLNEEDTIVLIDLDASSVMITGTGYAIGHYARWVSRGAFRVEASSSDPLVMVTAFVDYQRNRASFVIVNNADAERTVRVHLNRLTFAGPLSGERSYGDVRWEALGAVPLEGEANDAFVVTVPGKSVTSVGGGI